MSTNCSTHNSKQPLSAAGEEHVGKVAVAELEVSLVVELEEGGGEGVLLLQVDVVHFRLLRGVPAIFAHVYLRIAKTISNVVVVFKFLLYADEHL